MAAKYETKNAMNTFDFTQAIVIEMKQMRGYFKAVLNNVIILADNKWNRDIWDMSTNNLVFTIVDGQITSLMEEGYKRYDANDNLLEEVKDKMIDKQDYDAVFATLPESYIYSFDKSEDGYVICVDTDEHSYKIEISGTEDIQEWNRFMNKAIE